MKNEKKIGFFTLLLYRVILDIIYFFVQNPIFEYLGYPFQMNVTRLALSYVVVIALIGVMPVGSNKVSYLVMQLHTIIMIIPMTCLYSFTDFSTSFFLMISGIFIFQVILLRVLPDFKALRVKDALLIFIGFIAVTTVLVYGYLSVTQNFNLHVLNFANIYDIREEQSLHFPFTYFIVWQYRIINPILLVFGYYRKSKKMIFFSIAIQVGLFLFYPHKEVVLAIGFVFLILFAHRFKLQFYRFFTSILIVLSVVTSLFTKFTNIYMLYAVVPSRLLFGPARVKFQHYDFFSTKEKLMYSEGLIGMILGIEYPFDKSSGYMVGLANGFNSNSNTGYLAYAYDNAGIIGMLIISIAFVILLKIFDSQSKRLDVVLSFALIAYPMLILNDGDILTLMLTGGLFWVILLFFTIHRVFPNE